MHLARRKPLLAGLVLLPFGVALVTALGIYREETVIHIDFEKGYEDGFISGFHDRERAGDLFFRWTAGDSYVEVDHLPARGKLTVEARLVAIRPSGLELPQIRFTANGATVFMSRAQAGLAAYRFSLPLRGSSLRLGIHSDTFESGSRRLGVQARSIRLSAPGLSPALGEPLIQMTLAVAAVLGAFVLCGLSLPPASMVATGFTAAFSYLLARDSLRFTDYPSEILYLAAATLVVSGLLRYVLDRADYPHSAERPALIAILSGGLLLKLGVLFYPLMVGSDWLFHANRLAEVLQGHFHLTSVSQHDPPFRIPYPVSLYVVAAPWALAGLDRLAVLKALTAVMDVGIGFALFYMARRFLNDARAGLLAAVFYQLLPINTLAFSSGNFSNLFGVSTTVFFVGFLLRGWSGGRGASGAALFSLLALTSHFGTFLFDVILWPALLAALLWIAPPGPTRSRRRFLLAAVFASIALAAVYYAGYWELFAGQWHRGLSPDYATGETAVAGPLTKLQFNLAFYRVQLGIVFSLLALLGALPILRKVETSPFHAAAAAWIAVTLFFFAVDLMTALEVRYILQAAPVFSLFAAAYVSGAFERGKLGKAAALAALAYLVGVGLGNIRDCLLIRYH